MKVRFSRMKSRMLAVNLSDLDLQIGFVVMESGDKEDEEGVINYGNHSNRHSQKEPISQTNS